MCYSINNWQNIFLFLCLCTFNVTWDWTARLNSNAIFFFKISWTNNISARRRAIVFYVCGLQPFLLENARIFVPFRPGPLPITSFQNSFTILSRCSSIGGTRLTGRTWQCTVWYTMYYVGRRSMLSENKVIFCGIIFIVVMETVRLRGEKGS